jgi:hypothetical protein
MRLFLRSINIGGWHVSEFLKQFLDWKKEGPELAIRGATITVYENYNETVPQEHKHRWVAHVRVPEAVPGLEEEGTGAGGEGRHHYSI